jgi:glycosyltransferase involved in cell wall biosynthesis
MKYLDDKLIVCLSTADWDNPNWTNKQHIMSRLAKNNDVFYIESLGLRQPTIKSKDLTRIIKRLASFFQGIKKRNERLYVFSPIVIPFHKYKIIRIINEKLLEFYVRYGIKKIKKRGQQVIIWTYAPNVSDLIRKIKSDLIIYHCVDELSGIEGIPSEIINWEKDTVDSSDAIFTTSKELYTSKKEMSQKNNVYYLPNVADFEHFNKALTIKKRPKELNSINKPIIGFIGAISEYKIDIDLIRNSALHYKDFQFILIGKVGEGQPSTNIEKLKGLENVQLIGQKDYKDLPDYLAFIDVCIIPNLVNSYTKGVFPMKFFEYLAAGKPIVTTSMMNLYEFRDVAYISKDNADFIENISNALNESPGNSERRMSIAKLNTWESRIDSMDNIINQYYNVPK